MQGKLQLEKRKVKTDPQPNLYYQRGYGRLNNDYMEFSFVESAYLLKKNEIESIDGMGYNEFISYISNINSFLYDILCVYSDLRERGYYLQHLPNKRFIYLYERGEKPSESSPKNEVQVLREREKIGEKRLKRNLGVIDSDGDITYLKTKIWNKTGEASMPQKEIKGKKMGNKVVVKDKIKGGFGKKKKNYTLLSLLEAKYLKSKKLLTVQNINGIDNKMYTIYSDLRDSKLCPKTGFKFGSSFRIYKSINEKHSDYLVEIQSKNIEAKDLAGKTRLAHSVKKKSILAFIKKNSEDDIKYIQIERWRP